MCVAVWAGTDYCVDTSTEPLFDASSSRAEFYNTLAVARASNDRLYRENKELKAENKKLREHNTALTARRAEVEVQLKALAARLDAAGGSGPSSPPSTRNHNTRPYPTRSKSGRQSGGQKGHKGATLARRDPDETVRYEPSGVCACGANAADGKSVSTTTCQTVGVDVSVRATDHVAVTRRCGCGQLHKGVLPDTVPSGTAVSYDSSVKALVLALHTGGLLPTAVVASLTDAIADLSVSEGTINTWMATAAGLLDGFDAVCVETLNASSVVGVDETSVKAVNADGGLATVYVHAAVSDKITRFHCGSRSSDTITAGGVVGKFAGTLVSDCYATYFTAHTGAHQLCTAHLYREASWWSEQHTAPAGGGVVPDFAGIAQVFSDAQKVAGTGGSEQFATRLAALVSEGLVRMEGDTRAVSARPRAYLERLVKRADLLWHFVSNPDIPSTNNGAERAVRPLKTKMKRAGRFRTRAGLDNHVRLAGYVDTARKHGVDPLTALTQLAGGKPWLPPPE